MVVLSSKHMKLNLSSPLMELVKITSGLAVENTGVVLVCFKYVILFHSNAFLSPEPNLRSVLSYCGLKTAFC